MKVSFTILGEPQGKGRPRFSKVGNFVKAYTPEKTAAYENLVKLEYESQCRGLRFSDDERIDMRIYAYYGIPQSASKKRKAMMLEGIVRPSKKPDMDNVVKVIADSLNNVAYKDDTQIVDTMVRKFYSDTPRVKVVIQTAAERTPDQIKQLEDIGKAKRATAKQELIDLYGLELLREAVEEAEREKD